MLATKTPQPSDCVILATPLARSDLHPVSRQQLTTECHTASSARTKTLSESAVAVVSHLGPDELAVASSVTELYHRVIMANVWSVPAVQTFTPSPRARTTQFQILLLEVSESSSTMVATKQRQSRYQEHNSCGAARTPLSLLFSAGQARSMVVVIKDRKSVLRLYSSR